LGSHSDEATLVVSRRIRPGKEKDYEEWVKRITEAARSFPGFIGATTLVPEGPEPTIRYVVWRFEDKATLENWKDSPTRKKLIEEVERYATNHFSEATGLETWFALPNMSAITPPPKWKMALTTILGAFVVSFLAHLLLNPYLGPWPLFASTLVYICILVVLLTYLVMPNLSQLLRKWLYP